MDTWALILPIPALLGAILAFLGMRGRLVSTDPHCRKCGYNLVGSPASPTCPECGAALAAPHAIRHGSRKRRPWFIAFGLTLVLLSASVCGLATWQRLRNVNWYSYAPTTWLLWWDSPGAVTELLDRFKNNRFTGDEVTRVIERGLARQGDAKHPWNQDWGRLIEAAQDRKLLTDTQQRQYGKQAIRNVSLRIRAKVRTGDPIPVQAEYYGGRLGDRNLWMRVDVEKFCIGDLIDVVDMIHEKPRHVIPPSNPLYNPTGYWGYLPTVIAWDERLAALKPGMHSAAMTLKLSILNNSEDEVLDERRVTVRTQWQLLPADQPSAWLVVDPAKRAAMIAGLSAGLIDAYQDYVCVGLMHQQLPVPGVFRMTVMHDDHAWAAGSVGCLPFQRERMGQTLCSDRKFTSPRADILAEPDLDFAITSMDFVGEIWGEPILLKDVRVLLRNQ